MLLILRRQQLLLLQLLLLIRPRLLLLQPLTCFAHGRLVHGFGMEALIAETLEKRLGHAGQSYVDARGLGHTLLLLVLVGARAARLNIWSTGFRSVSRSNYFSHREVNVLLRTRSSLLVSCLTSQQHARVFQRRICLDNCTCCHTERGGADPTCYLTQSQCTDTEPATLAMEPIAPGSPDGHSHKRRNV